MMMPVAPATQRQSIRVLPATPTTAGNANISSHCSLLANAHVVADVNPIVALGAVTLKYSPETGDDRV